MAQPTGQARQPDASAMCEIRPPERDETMNGSEAGGACEVAADAGRNPRLSRRKTLLAPVCASLAAWGLAAFLIFGPLTVGVSSATTDAPSEPAKSVALLNVQFLNDHEDLEPTTDAERARVALIASKPGHDGLRLVTRLRSPESTRIAIRVDNRLQKIRNQVKLAA
jgi:hypothetical protein